MALTSDEEELKRIALAALPRWIASNENVGEAFAAFAAQIGAARAQASHWLGDMAHVSTSTGVASPDIVDYLDALAKDRGLKRADGESDEGLRYRLRNPADAINYGSLLPLVNGILDADGVVGTAVMYDLRSNRAFFGDNEPQTGTGGTFALVSGTTYKFTPTAGWQDNRPPYADPSRVDVPATTHKLVFTGAANAGNDGTFTVTGISVNGATYTNASGVAAVDAGVAWRVDRYNWRPAQLTPGTGAGKAYLNRGFRMGGSYPTIQLMLPYGTSEATLQSILAAMGVKKGAGVRVVVERRKTAGVYLTGPATAETDAFEVTPEIIVTVYSGSLPTSIAQLSGWTGTACWTVMHNYNDATVGPSACNSVSDGAVLNMQKLGAGSTATLVSAPQDNFSTQEGYTVNANDDSLYYFASANWKFSATVPTGYLITFRFAGTPASGQIFFGGVDGASGGWYLEAHATSGIRAGIGSGSAYANTSYVGGTSFYDGDYHTILLVVDDAAGKAKIYTEFGNVESTGLTISSGNALITVGPLSSGATWGTAVTYLLTARGEHALMYTNAQSAFDAYEAARLGGTFPAAVTGLPTTLSQLDTATGYTFTNGFNLNSLTPSNIAGGAGLSAYTGVMQGGSNGTAPTLNAAPQIKTSFSAQASIGIDSSVDNLQGASAMPDGVFTAVLVVKPPSGGHPGSSRFLVGRMDNVVNESGWYVDTGNANTYRVTAYNKYAADARTATVTITSVAADNAWHVIVVRRAAPSGVNRIKVDGATTATSSANSATAFTSVVAQGGLGKLYECDLAHTPFTCSMAFFAWANTACSDAEVETISNNFRWKYGL